MTLGRAPPQRTGCVASAVTAPPHALHFGRLEGDPVSPAAPYGRKAHVLGESGSDGVIRH